MIQQTHTIILAGSILASLKQFVSDQKIHPILVNFTAALVPISIFSDILARIFRRESLRATGWWTLFFAACITPLTATAGWLFWMPDDRGVTNMTIHKWLGTSLTLVFVALALWRWHFYRRGRSPHLIYLAVGVLFVAALAYQSHLGGDQSFGPMDTPAPAESSRGMPAPGKMDMPMDHTPAAVQENMQSPNQLLALSFQTRCFPA